jgi:Na+/H+ antiporter NhaC
VLILLFGATFVVEWTRAPVAPIWPSIVALVAVFATRNVLGGLLFGAVTGSILLMDGQFWRVPLDLVETHLLPNFSSGWKTGAVIFTLLLGGFVHLLERGGGLQRLLGKLLHGQSPRKVESGAAAFGLLCFFDGLANSLMVGRIFRPMAARSGVSRVRLAWIVDTTSASVACVAVISTWIAYQLAMIREGYAMAGRLEEAEPYALFFASIPHNYYVWFSLILLTYAIWRQWNVGPMERVGRMEKPDALVTETVGAVGGLWRAAVPVAALLGIVFVGIYIDGTKAGGVPPLPFRVAKLADAFSAANVPAVLIVASAIGALLAWAFFPRAVLSKGDSAGAVFTAGMLQLFSPVLILIMAWMLSSTLGALGAADYLGAALGDRLDPAVFPTLVFLLGALVAFTTGTSWGTMGLLMPLAIPITFQIAGPGAMELMPVVVGAVFSGAVFGDHCSPISDTTIVTSLACGVDPLDHVQTQLPYALMAAAGASLIGFPMAGMSDGHPLVAMVALAAYTLILVAIETILRRGPTKA